jgi:ABC-type nitrate/sulfonate/bicarbonate transport system permease component
MAGVDHAPAQAIAEVESSRRLEAIGWGLVRALSIVLFLALWEGIARSGWVTPFMLPTIPSVLERIWSDAASGELFVNLGLTLYRSLVGFAIAATGGIVLGMLITRSTVGHWFFDPIVSVGFPMPKIAFLPVVILWLGFYDVTKISMVVLDAIFPVVTATVAGIQSVDKELIWSARNMGTDDRRLVWDILLPAALPQILTGLQVALPIALIVAIIAEMMLGGYGIGGAMSTASRFADSRGVFAGLVEIAVVGYCLVKGLAMIRRRLLVWHQEALEPTTV